MKGHYMTDCYLKQKNNDKGMHPCFRDSSFLKSGRLARKPSRGEWARFLEEESEPRNNRILRFVFILLMTRPGSF